MQNNAMIAASRRAAIVPPIAMPTIAPVERPLLAPGRGPEVEFEGAVAVAVKRVVVMKRGGRVTVGGIWMDAQAVKFEDKQQKEVAFGDVLPQ